MPLGSGQILRLSNHIADDLAIVDAVFAFVVVVAVVVAVAVAIIAVVFAFVVVVVAGAADVAMIAVIFAFDVDVVVVAVPAVVLAMIAVVFAVAAVVDIAIAFVVALFAVIRSFLYPASPIVRFLATFEVISFSLVPAQQHPIESFDCSAAVATADCSQWFLSILFADAAGAVSVWSAVVV